MSAATVSKEVLERVEISISQASELGSVLHTYLQDLSDTTRDVENAHRLIGLQVIAKRVVDLLNPAIEAVSNEAKKLTGEAV